MSNTKDTPIDYKQFEGHTPEQILDQCLQLDNDHFRPLTYEEDGAGGSRSYYRHDLVIDAMKKYADQQNASLKLELQKQKVLKDELVNALKWLKSRIDNHDIMIKSTSARRFEELESLIKKSNEI